MGERAQILIEDTGVYLYTHWGGIEIIDLLRTALKRKQRWDDPEYFGRIIFCEMIKGEEKEETGYGIGTKIHSDLDHPLIIINCKEQIVTYLDKKLSFEDFIITEEDEVERK